MRSLIFKHSVLGLIHSLILLLILGQPLSAKAGESVAELVWVENSDSSHALYLARYQNNTWHKSAAPIYTSDNAITAPALGTDKNGMRLLIWTEQRNNKFVLMMSVRNKVSLQSAWSNAQQFSDFGIENFSATMVRDITGVLWVFWSASIGGLSDIYVSKQTNVGWSKPSKINDNNKVPDSHPEARLNEEGNIAVSWSSYNIQSNTYERVHKEINREFDAVAIAELADKTLESDIPIPSFLPSSSIATLHFPNNKSQQSIRVGQ